MGAPRVARSFKTLSMRRGFSGNMRAPPGRKRTRQGRDLFVTIALEEMEKPMDKTSRISTNLPDQDWRALVSPYQAPSFSKSVSQLINSLGPYLLLWVLMWLSLRVSYWLTLALAVLAAGFLVRVFIIFHDCGHGSFFRSNRLNDIWGIITGLLVFTPYYAWRHNHAVHHASAANLDRRGVGDVMTATVREYLAMPWYQKLWYRTFRNPLVMLTIGPLLIFLVVARFPSKAGGKRERDSVLWSNLALAGLVAGMSALIGFKAYLMIQLPVMALAAATGVWLFYVQHNFDGTYWVRREQWDYLDAALKGSSSVQLAVHDAQRPHLIGGVVRRAHQRPALHPLEADPQPVGFPELGELFRGVVALDRQVLLAGLQILADRQDIHAPLRWSRITALTSSIVSPSPSMIPDLVSTSGSSCLALVRVAGGPFVAVLRLHLLEQARHGLDVVVQDLGRASITIFKASRLPLKVRDQHLDRAAGMQLADAADHHGKDRRAAVLAVVAVDAGDHGVLQVHVLDRLGDALGLQPVQRHPGWPRLISQKPQVRVHTSPSIRKVAVPAPQHSPRLGHIASSHTVCSSLLRISPCSHSKVSPDRGAHGGSTRAGAAARASP
jgi:acyl-lipid omega-6 desaturase (Delta-12 desaturase)